MLSANKLLTKLKICWMPVVVMDALMIGTYRPVSGIRLSCYFALLFVYQTNRSSLQK